MIACATDLLIVALLVEGQKRRAIEAPELVRILNDTDDSGEPQKAGTERLELGSLGRLEQYVSNEITDMTNGCDLPC